MFFVGYQDSVYIINWVGWLMSYARNIWNYLARLGYIIRHKLISTISCIWGFIVCWLSIRLEYARIMFHFYIPTLLHMLAIISLYIVKLVSLDVLVTLVLLSLLYFSLNRHTVYDKRFNDTSTWFESIRILALHSIELVWNIELCQLNSVIIVVRISGRVRLYHALLYRIKRFTCTWIFGLVFRPGEFHLQGSDLSVVVLRFEQMVEAVMSKG